MPSAGTADTVESSLAGRIRGGDRAAEEELVSRFRRSAYLIALVRVDSVVDAEDLAQEAMLQVLQALRQGRLRDEDRLPAFVGGTIRNIIRAHFRGEQRIDRLKSFQSTGDEGDPESDCGRGELLELARISLARLEPRDQEILRLWLVEDLSLSEIADRVGIRPAAARQRKLRALRRARKNLDDLSQTSKHGHY